MYIKDLIYRIIWTVFFLKGSCLGYADEVEKIPNQLNCTFTDGFSISYEEGKFTREPAKHLSFNISKIDLDAQKAEIKMNSNMKPLSIKIVRAINANHFLEVVNEGFLNLTTVYDKDVSKGVYPAVHSRHFGFLGQPVFGHYTGLCVDN